MQTFRAIMSLIFRVVLLGIAVPLLLADFPNYKLPYRFPPELAVIAPLLRWRKFAFLAGAAALGAHYYYRHLTPLWELGYMGVAIVFVLLPSSGRGDGKKKRKPNILK